MGTGRGLAVALALATLSSSTGPALETDQYYAWGRELEDSAEVLNAKLNLELSLAAEEANRRPASTPATCREVAAAFRQRLHFTTFQNIELWAFKSELVSRAPAGPAEELEYRRTNLYHDHGPFDVGTSLPDSPTVEVDGVRFGTDKLAHFVSSGWRWYENYLSGLERGMTPEEAERRAIRDGVFWERTMLGLTASGVLSLADLEANYQGMRFFHGLCEREDPTLALAEGQWRVAHPVDLRRHVSPEWDESYQTPVYSKRRWRRVRPVLETYCDRLALPAVQRQRSSYARRDRVTAVEEFVGELVRQGKLPDPQQYSVEVACGVPRSRPFPASGSLAEDRTLPQASTGETDLMAELARRDADRHARPIGLVGVQISSPEALSAAVGAMWVELPREYDCTTVCSFQGPTLQLAAGLGGGRVSLGWARVVGDSLGRHPFVTDPYVGLGVRGTLLRTWGDQGAEPAGATFLGGEVELTIVQVSFRLGLLHHVGGTSSGGPWLVAGGIGWGF